MEFLNFDVELVEDGAKRAERAVVVGDQGGPARTKDSQIELGVKERDLEPVTGCGVAMRLGNPVNQTLEAQPPKVVRHLRGGVGATEERFDRRTQVVVVKAAQMT